MYMFTAPTHPHPHTHINTHLHQQSVLFVFQKVVKKTYVTFSLLDLFISLPDCSKNNISQCLKARSETTTTTEHDYER